MKRLVLVAALAGLAAATTALAQTTTPPDYTPPPASGAAVPAPSGSVPPIPSLDANQSAEVQRQLAPYRTQIDARVARGEITPEEAGRLLQWREWQIARQVTANAVPSTGAYNPAPPPGARGNAPTYDQGPPPSGAYGNAPPTYDQGPPPGYDQAPPPVAGQYYAPPPYYPPYYAPYYGPYYAPYYYGPTYYRPAPYYWGARICAGGWGHHGGARICV